jgi:hypothetical protein
MGQWTIGQWTMGNIQWDTGTLELGEQVGQGDNAQCDNVIWGTGTKKHWYNGTLDSGTMDK